MADRLRFHLDEHVDPDLARALRTHRIDVTTTIGAGLRTQDDEAQWDYILKERRVLVTSDADFLRLGAERMDHPGVVFCTSRDRTMGTLIRNLVLMYEVLTPVEMQGRIEFF